MTPAEHDLVTAAIREAEARTSGEIYCVVARASDGYLFPAAATCAFSILIAGVLVAFALEFWWLSVRLPVFAALELAAFAAAFAVLAFLPALRLRLTPRAWQFAAARDNARRQFLARNVHLTSERTGVLIFVSVAERYAEVVADTGIDAKVPQEAWNAIVAALIGHARAGRLAAGYVEAVQAVGVLLAEHFPVRAGDANELDDHLVEL